MKPVNRTVVIGDSSGIGFGLAVAFHEKTMDIDLKGTFVSVQKAFPLMTAESSILGTTAIANRGDQRK